MKTALRRAYEHEVRRARTARSAGDLKQAFAALERAHILGQRHFLAHLGTHARMLQIAFLRRDLREVWGQLLRMVATVPGFLSGWVPKGNSGGANVSAFKSMTVPADLAPYLDEFNVRDDVRRRVLVLAAASLLLDTAAIWMERT